MLALWYPTQLWVEVICSVKRFIELNINVGAYKDPGDHLGQHFHVINEDTDKDREENSSVQDCIEGWGHSQPPGLYLLHQLGTKLGGLVLNNILTTCLSSSWAEKMSYTVKRVSGPENPRLEIADATSCNCYINSISLSSNFHFCEIGIIILSWKD